MIDVLGVTGRAVLDLVLPARCMTCEVTVATPGQLCGPCFGRTRFVTDPCCQLCGAPFDHLAQGGRLMACAACTANPPEWRQARAAMTYDEQSRRMILPFKHGDRVETALGLARHMVRAGSALLQDADCLVPVPLHRSRLRQRRYNQSALLARAIGRLSGHPALLDALRRTRATRSLGALGPASRAAAVAGAFAVRPARVEGRRVLLIDDVLTTGATAGACARALLAAGAVQVDLLVAARVSGYAAT